MGKLKQRRLQVAKEEADREKAIKNACDEYKKDGFHQFERCWKLMGFIIPLCAGT